MYTNAAAQLALDFAATAATALGSSPKPAWAAARTRIPVLFDGLRGAHPEYAGYEWCASLASLHVLLLAPSPAAGAAFVATALPPVAPGARSRARVPTAASTTRAHPCAALCGVCDVRGTPIKQADVVLLASVLRYNMSEAVRAADLTAYEPVTDPNGPAMTWAMHAVGHLQLGQLAEAARLFNRSFANVRAGAASPPSSD